MTEVPRQPFFSKAITCEPAEDLCIFPELREHNLAGRKSQLGSTWRSTVKRLIIAIATGLALISCFPAITRADDVADVKAAEMTFNAAENAGDADGMFKHLLPDRTVFGFSGGRLVEGWTEESKKRRQAGFDAGRKFDLRIEELNVHIYGETAITTFYRVGTIKEADGVAREVRLRISGVWIRQKGEWKLAHRHESPF